jgi:hypothetical protein
MVMTLPHTVRPMIQLLRCKREHEPRGTDLLPWADPYIASLIAAHERAVQTAGKSGRLEVRSWSAER